jgi:enterochelin esterase-like enzyme
MQSSALAKKVPLEKPSIVPSKDFVRTMMIDDFFSAALKHNVKLEVLLPPWYNHTLQFEFKVLLLNDGQQLHRLKMHSILTELYTKNLIPPIIVVGIHAHNRMQEYGVAGVPDYKKRGAKAEKYSRFVVNELLPLLKKNFRVSEEPGNFSIAGFSLGGLSAFDIAWNYPHLFANAGMFSASFWWRSKGYDQGYDDTSDRIMHKIVRSTDSKSNQRFWFECGTKDEMADRNGNGIIDAIEDTQDIIAELELLGYKQEKDLKYVEVEGGTHSEETWSEVMPEFLQWCFA